MVTDGMKNKVLVIVHPGAACHAADVKLGPTEAKQQRRRLIKDLLDWKGSNIIITSDLFADLQKYHLLKNALDDLQKRTDGGETFSRQIYGDPFAINDHMHALDVAMNDEEINLDPAKDHLFLTGAWFNHQSEDGAVQEVMQKSKSLGFNYKLMQGVMRF